MTSLTPADRALELFQHRPELESPIDWLANQLLALAGETRRLAIQLIPAAEGQGPVFECSDSVHIVRSGDNGPMRLFRTLLARFAKMAEEENGTAFNAYGGKLHFERDTPNGPVRLEVEFENTTRAQAIAIEKRR
jgi:hypothetical protein